jgi:putative methyltransferase (TIGR04325 family)
MEQASIKIRDLLMDTLAAPPCRWVLGSLEKSGFGLRLLNRFCNPRSVFKSFGEAWKAAKNTTYAGHDHPDYLRIQVELSGMLRPSDYAVLYWLSRTRMNPLRVLDYGGSVGNIYYSYAEHLRQLTGRFEWVVFDLPPIVDAGRRFAEQRGEHDLLFASSLKELEGEFVVHISSAFHYWEKSVDEFIAQLPCQPRHIIVNRVPVNKDESTFVTVQFKKTYAVPCIVRNRDELVSDFDTAGYALVDSWMAPELRLRMPLFPGHNVPAYSGFYFARKNALTLVGRTDVGRTA